MTNEDLKQKLIIELFNTGKIDGLYFGRKSKSKINPIKAYIENVLYRSFLPTSSLFNDDIYMELFVHLQNMPADKFVRIYQESPRKLLATALRIIILKCFASDNRTNNPKHSLVKNMLYGSSYSPNNYVLDPIEIIEEDRGDSDNTLILYDLESDDFSDTYGFTPEEVISYMNEDDKAFFNLLIGTQKRGKPTKEHLNKKEELFTRIKGIKENLDKRDSND